MALIHMKAREVFVSERAKHAHAADPKQNFLAQTIVRIAAVQAAGEVAVPFSVGGKIGVEKIDRNNEAANSLNVIAPAAKLDAPVLQGHGYAGGLFLEKIFDFPNHWLFRLRAVLGEMLRKESSAIKKRRGHHGKAKVGGDADGVSGEDAEAAAIARHGVLEGNLHREVGDKAFNLVCLRGHLSRFSAGRHSDAHAGKMVNL